MAAYPHRTAEDEKEAERWWGSVCQNNPAQAAKNWYATALAYEREIATLRTLLKMDTRLDADETL